MSVTWITATDHVLELTGLTNGVTGELISDADVTVTVVNAQGNVLPGETWPLTVAPVEGEPGTYRATLSADLPVSSRQCLDAIVVADAGVGLKRTWHVSVQGERYPGPAR